MILVLSHALKPSTTVKINSNALDKSCVEFMKSDLLRSFSKRHIKPRFTGRKCGYTAAKFNLRQKKCIENIKKNIYYKHTYISVKNRKHIE